MLPHIIHCDQNAFVKRRIIFDTVRTISNVMDFTKQRGYHSIMTAIDFEKAFDSVNWNFLLKSLETFGFGESFIAWITMFYKNILSCVTNNGFSTPFLISNGGGGGSARAIHYHHRILCGLSQREIPHIVIVSDVAGGMVGFVHESETSRMGMSNSNYLLTQYGSLD